MRSRAAAAPVALALALLQAPRARAADLSAASRIDAVEVYRGSARVSRVARVELPAGSSRVLFAGLPEQLADDSLRAEGKGVAGARIFGVAVDRVAGAQAAAAEARAAEQALERLQDEDRALEDRGRVARARQAFVESLRSTYAEERAKNLAVRGVSSREWADLARFVESEMAAAGAEARRADAARRDLARRLRAAREDLEKVQAKRGAATKTVAVEVEAERPGALELAVSYTVPSAGWEPVWDARLLTAASAVELSLLASVVNRSGEDWSRVTLSVSTAQPGRGLRVPVLEPRYLERASERPLPVARKAAAAQAPATAGMVREAGLADAEEAKAEVALASVQEGALSATFVAPRRESVDGAGQARRIALQRLSLKAEVGRTSAPRIDPAAFVTARAANSTGVPILAGMAAVYLDDQFVGRAPVAATPPGGELRMAFGADPRVEVERRVLERSHETAGLVSKDEVWQYRTRITVKNRWAAPVSLRLLDLVPVSREKDIEVQVLEGTAQASEDPDRPGVRVHDLRLEPREERAIEIRYRVRFPRGFPVQGLE